MNDGKSSDTQEKAKTSILSSWKSKKKIEKRILLSRLLVFLSFAVTGVILAATSYYFLVIEEEDSFKTQYQAIMDDFTLEVSNGLHAAHYSSASAAGLIGLMYNDEWPFVRVNSFDDMYKQYTFSYVFVSGLAPIVRRDQVDEFNEFSINHTSYPIRDFMTLMPYNESTGFFGSCADNNTCVDNETGVLPFINLSPFIVQQYTSMDAHLALRSFAKSIEVCLDSKKHIDSENASVIRMQECSIMSAIGDILVFIDSPTFVVTVPVLGQHTKGKEAVAYYVSAVIFEHTLMDLAPPNMPEVICVVERKFPVNTVFAKVFSFRISGSEVVFLGYDDLHDPMFNGMKRSSIFGFDKSAPNSSVYSISFYPTKAFRDSYHTMTPIITSVLFALVATVVTIIFFVYDRAVHTESLAREVVLATKKNFVRYISHEIRTPLNTVLLGLDVLHVVDRINKFDKDDPAQSAELSKVYEDITDIAEEVKSGAAVAVAVLNDLLDYDRLDMSRMNINVKPIPAVRFLRNTMSTLKRQLIDNANINNVTFTTSLFASEELPVDSKHIENVCFGHDRFFPAENLYLLGDVYRLEQVFRHMISNSLKYIPQDGRITFEVHWRELGISGKRHDKNVHRKDKYGKDFELYENYADHRCGVVSVIVKDNGPGISEEFINEVFTDEVDFDTRLGRSKGLGLCISKQIISLHHGQIWATGKSEVNPENENLSDEESVSSLENGTTFTIELPVYSLSEDQQNSLATQQFLRTREGSANINSAIHRKSDSVHQSSFIRRESSINEHDDEISTKELSKRRQSINKPIRINCKYNRILVVDDAAASRKVGFLLYALHSVVCSLYWGVYVI